MLVLSRKVGQTVVIDGRITITLLGVRNRQIRIGIVAPSDTRVLRGELAPFPAETVVASDSSQANGSANGNGSAITLATDGVVADREPALARETVAAGEAAVELTFDPTLLATADGLVCESFGDSIALGEHRGRHAAEDMETGAECEPRTSTAAAKPARSRGALGLRGFRETRRSRSPLGNVAVGAAAARVASEQPAATPSVGHTARATAG